MKTPCFSQQYLFDAQQITTEDGLAHLGTEAIYKDKKGFLWISTGYGLNRYDGYSFKLYDAKKNNLFQDYYVRKIKEDDEGNLWLFYESFNRRNNSYSIDISIFNPITEMAISFEDYFGLKAPFKLDEISNVLIKDPQNRPWIITKTGTIFLYREGRFEKIHEQEGGVEFAAVDLQENIWIVQEGFLMKVPGSQKISSDATEKFLLPDKNLTNLWFDKDQTLWLSTYNYTSGEIATSFWYKKDGNEDFIAFEFSRDGKHLLESKKDLDNFVHRDKKGNWYLNVDKKRVQVFDKNGVFLHDFNLSINPDFEISIISFLEDERHLWFTFKGGVLKTSIRTNPFVLIQAHKGYSDCRAITEDESGNIYFVNDQLYQWDPINRQVNELSSYTSNFGLLYTNKYLWVSGYGSVNWGFQFNLDTGEDIMYPVSGAFNHIYTFIQTDSPGQFLVGQSRGLSILDLNEHQVLPIDQFKSVANSMDHLLQNSRVYHLHQNLEGLWAATENGVFLMDSSYTVVQHFSTSNSTLPFDHIRHIHEDENNILWLATKGGGIIKWQPSLERSEASIYRQFTTADGLSNNFTYGIYEDEFDNLWISSDHGLMCMNTKNLQVSTYFTTDGLPHNEFNSISHYQANDGTLYFGGLGGLISFDPKDLHQERITPSPLEFTGLFLLESGHKEMTAKTDLLQFTDEITIRPSDKFFEAHFSLMDYDIPEKHQYAFRIGGYDENWNYINENYLRITHLPPGKYTLTIKGQNRSVGWSENELSLKINVLWPFYFRWWFILMLLILILIIVILAIRNHRKLMLKNLKLATLNEQNESKNNLLAIMAHDLKGPAYAFNNLTKKLAFLIRKEDPKRIEKLAVDFENTGTKIYYTFENLLNWVTSQRGNITYQKQTFALIPLLDQVVESLSFQNHAKQVKIKYELGTKTLTTDIEILKIILFNLLNNAIKYSDADGEILIKTYSDAHHYHIEIIDYGTGMEEALINKIGNGEIISMKGTHQEKGYGIGLKICFALAQHLQGEIKIESEVGKGSVFGIVLPE